MKKILSLVLVLVLSFACLVACGNKDKGNDNNDNNTNTNTGNSEKVVAAACERDNFMSAEEAVKFGLIDRILTSRRDVAAIAGT